MKVHSKINQRTIKTFLSLDFNKTHAMRKVKVLPGKTSEILKGATRKGYIRIFIDYHGLRLACINDNGATFVSPIQKITKTGKAFIEFETETSVYRLSWR